jgi:predicted DNA-binding transcriptional regulator AlpA
MSIGHSPARQTRIISRREFRKRLGGISRTTEHRLSKAGDPNFPELVWVSPGLTGYYENEAQTYIDTRPRVAPHRIEAETEARRSP